VTSELPSHFTHHSSPILPTTKQKTTGYDHSLVAPRGRTRLSDPTNENFAGDGELISFELDKNGKVTRLLLGNTPSFSVGNW
jgi:hypothetical protein